MQRLLVQLDPDRHPSLFDRVVAYDAGADQVLSYGGVETGDVEGLVHGAIFTRGPKHLNRTALFIGGSDVSLAEELLEAAQAAFFGSFRVSILLDPNGANTTAAAAVRRLVDGMGGDVSGRRALVLAGTGPVGARVAGLLAQEGAEVRITSRKASRSEEAARQISERFDADVSGAVAAEPDEVAEAVAWSELLLSSGPAGVQMVPRPAWSGEGGPRVVVDLNAVPPAGIEGVEPGDDGEEREGAVAWGALGIGGLKMEIHRSCVARLFTANDLLLDAEAVYEIAMDV